MTSIPPCVTRLAAPVAAASLVQSGQTVADQGGPQTLQMRCPNSAPPPTPAARKALDEQVICAVMCCCSESKPATYRLDSLDRRLRQRCADEVFEAADWLLRGKSRYKSELAWNTRSTPPVPGGDGGRGYRRYPDITIVEDPCQDPGPGNVERIVELKFGDDERRKEQDDAYLKIAGDDEQRYQVFRCGGVPQADDETVCECPDEPEPKPVPVPVPVPALGPKPATDSEFAKWGKALGWSAVTAAAAVATVAAILSPFEGPAGDVAAGGATLGAAARAAAAWRALAIAF